MVPTKSEIILFSKLSISKILEYVKFKKILGKIHAWLVFHLLDTTFVKCCLIMIIRDRIFALFERLYTKMAYM
jgi:hypothetical protein